MRYAAAALALLSCILTGCAYYSTTSAYLPAHLKTIAIPPFGNRSYEPGVAEDLTRAVTDRFDATGRLSVVGRRNANSILEVTVTRVTDESFTIGSGELEQKRQLTIEVSAAYRDLTTGVTMWEDAAVDARETYELSGIIDRDTALENAIDQLASDLFNRTLSGW